LLDIKLADRTFDTAHFVDGARGGYAAAASALKAALSPSS